MANTKGKIMRVSGPVVEAENLKVNMSDIVQVGEEALIWVLKRLAI